MNERLEYIDLLKGVGIILMIMGHIIFLDSFQMYIHMFHMQLFFFISGYLFKEKIFYVGYFFWGKVRSLLVPYFVFGFFHLCLKLILIFYRNDSYIQPFYQLFWCNTGEFPIAGALWFLTALFWMQIIYFFTICVDMKFVRLILILGIIILGMIVSKVCRLPLGIDISMVCLGFMYCGELLKENINIPKQSIFKAIVVLAVGFYLGFLNGNVNVREAVYGNILLFYFCAVSICYSLLVLSYKLLLMFRNFWIMDIFIFIGKRSIIFLAFNQLLVWAPNRILSSYSGGLLYVGYILTLVITVLALYALAKLFDNHIILRRLISK